VPEARLERLLAELREEFPALEILPKDQVWHQRFLGGLLRLITFGGQRHYLDHYTTTLGTRRIYVPSGWQGFSAAQRYVILRHERVHLRQFRRYSFVGMALIYILLPLPAFLAYGRYVMERAGYEETIRAAREVYGRGYVCDPIFQEGIVRQFTSGAYGWMWPFPATVRRWVSAVAEEET
jgi:hypothetical protein